MASTTRLCAFVVCCIALYVGQSVFKFSTLN